MKRNADIGAFYGSVNLEFFTLTVHLPAGKLLDEEKWL